MGNIDMLSMAAGMLTDAEFGFKLKRYNTSQPLYIYPGLPPMPIFFFFITVSLCISTIWLKRWLACEIKCLYRLK